MEMLEAAPVDVIIIMPERANQHGGAPTNAGKGR
jgi:hypothetical protein